MSQSAVTSIKPTLVVDPRLAWSETGERKFGVERGGALNTWKPVTTSSFSNGYINFSGTNPPAPNVALGRQVFVLVTFQVELTGTNESEDPFYFPAQGYSCPRYAPLAQVTNNVSVVLNGTNISQNNYMLINAQAHYLDNNAKNSNSGMWPDMPDSTWNYGLFNSNLLGSAGNPLAPYGNSIAQYITRGSFPVQIMATTATTATLQFTTCEPLFLSPFEINTDEPGGALIGIQQFQISYNLQNLARVWSWDAYTAGLDNGRTITGINVSVVGPPTAMLNFITPLSVETIPKSISYNYNSTYVYQSGPFTAGAGADFTATSNNIQLNYIPSRIMVFLRQQDSDLFVSTGANAPAYSNSDYFAIINNVSINYDNRSGILAEAPPQALFQISQKNGYNKSWQAWNTFLGGVAMFDFASDICMNNPAEAPSLQTTKQFQITIKGTNTNQVSSVNYTLYIVTISNGLFTIYENSSIAQNSVLTPQDILDATTSSVKMEPKITKGDNFLGGNFSAGLRKFAGKLNTALRETHAISTIAGMTGHPKVAEIARAAGYGLVGGAKLKKKQLQY